MDGEFWLSTLAVAGLAGTPFDKLEVSFGNPVDVEAFSGLDIYPIAAGRPSISYADWDTTTVPDDRYEIRANFRDAEGNVLGTLRRDDVLINNSVVWHQGAITGIGILDHSGMLTVVNTIISGSLEYGIDWDNGPDAPIVRYSNVWGSGTADFMNAPRYPSR